MNLDTTQYLCEYQKAWLRETAPLAFGEKSRRIGWTWVQAAAAVKGRIDGQSNYYHSSADQTASVEFIDYCSQWAAMANEVAKVSEAKEVIDDSEISSLVMTFANGRKIVAGSSNPKFFRSKGGEVGLDEFAFHRDGRELYKAAHATAMFWGYPLRIWSTHNGPGSYFNVMLQAAKQGKLRGAVHTVTILDAVRDGIVERIIMRKKKLQSPPAADEKARQEWLDELRSTCPDEDTWNEEYLCVPSSDQSSLLSYDLIRGCERSAADLQIVEDISNLKFNGPIYLGWDVARRRDLSVIWGLGKMGDVFETRLVKKFAATDYTSQEGYFNKLMSDPRVKRACIDRTGIGDMLAERAADRFGKYRAEGVSFSLAVKADLAMPLKRLFEDKLIRVPDDAETRESLHKIRKIVTTAGNVRFDAKHDEDGHADEFWAIALAYHAADDLSLPLPSPVMNKPEGW